MKEGSCRWRRGGIVAIVAVLSVIALQVRVSAHGIPLDLPRWGPFLPASAQCLRVMGRAVRGCFAEAYAAERHCAASGCTGAERETLVGAAVSRARGAVERACRVGHLVELQFFSIDDAQDDLERDCRRASQDVSRWVGSDADDNACAAALGEKGAQFVRRSLRIEMTALDRIASRLATVEDKATIVERARTSVAALGTALASGAPSACDATAVGYLVDRVHCLIQSVYVQSTIRCAMP